MAAAEPRTRYASAGGAHIAFQVLGTGGPDLVVVPGLTSHLEVQWEDPAYRSFVRRLARFSRVIRFDKRGTGLSDPVGELPTLEERVADLGAVIAEAGAERPFLLGYSEGGPIALQYAATYRDGLTGLVLYGTSARNPPPWAVEKLRSAMDGWGTGASIELFAPSLAGDPVARSERARLERASASPAMARAIVGALALTDVRSLVERVTVPTLVLQRTDEFVPIDEARHLAAHVAGAELVELPGIDHIPWVGDSDTVVTEIERFLAKHSQTPTRATPRRPSRVRGARPSAGWPSLTEREQAVAALVTEGASNPEIARRLFISRQTVETHVKHIFGKLGVDSRSAVAAEVLKRRNT